MATHTIPAPGPCPEATGKTRREAFTAIGATSLAAIAAAGFALPETIEPATTPGPSPDVELLALIEQFNQAERAIHAYFEREPEGDDADGYAFEAEREALEATQGTLLDSIVENRAKTAEGIRARAAMLRFWHECLERNGAPGNYWNDRMTWAIVRDVVGEA